MLLWALHVLSISLLLLSALQITSKWLSIPACCQCPRLALLLLFKTRTRFEKSYWYLNRFNGPFYAWPRNPPSWCATTLKLWQRRPDVTETSGCHNLFWQQTAITTKILQVATILCSTATRISGYLAWKKVATLKTTPKDWGSRKRVTY